VPIQNKETDDACDGAREGDRGQREGFRDTPQSRAMMEAMGRFNEELREAGILRRADGPKP
jgi:hypothetical protein